MRHLELYLMMLGSSASIFKELFGGPAKHQPLDPDGTIPTVHLHNFEHASISLSIFIYAIFAIILDKVKPHVGYPLLLYIGSIAFAQELLLFHLHSTDHTGIEVENKTFHYKKEDAVDSETRSFIEIGNAFEPAALESFPSSPKLIFALLTLQTFITDDRSPLRCSKPISVTLRFIVIVSFSCAYRRSVIGSFLKFLAEASRSMNAVVFV
ncbi:hypothetical protein RJ641_035001 [Dillenia turbinata]|uniref:Uncharacterized protein n=1 Tax=Dillenia turbinata TaxID=194707 RepID=A0AAN8ZE78_9MAGN